MKFISTEGHSAPMTLKEAVARCVAPGGGLLMPEFLPRIPAALYRNIAEMNLREIAFVVAETLLGEDISGPQLKTVTDYAFAQDIPLRHLDGNIYALELFHGPSLTFKDYGERFMARLLPLIDGNSRRTVLVATTGNTGAAAANGLFRQPDTDLFVLYPRGRLSRSQTAMFASLGENIHPVEVAGTIEECKLLMQKAIDDPSLAAYNLTGANSINIARLIPQITFVMHAYARLRQLEVPEADSAVYSIPCGNASNIVAATMARFMGLPMGRIIAATNTNNQLAPLISGQPSVHGVAPVRTLAPSTDMTYPSSWPRIAYLYKDDPEALSRDIYAAPPLSDTEIAAAVNHLKDTTGYIIDPHGAMAYKAAEDYPAGNAPKVVFATGHPATRLDIMTGITGSAIELPHQLNRFMSGRHSAVIIPPTIPALRKILQTTIH